MEEPDAVHERRERSIERDERAATIGLSVHRDETLAWVRRVGDVMTRRDAVSESIAIPPIQTSPTILC